MRFKFLVIIFAFAATLLAQSAHSYEKLMDPVTERKGWLDLFGGWNEQGAPYIQSAIFSSRWDSHLQSRTLTSPTQIELVGDSGEVHTYGASVETESHGSGRSWSAYVPIWEPYKRFRILGPALSSVSGQLECAETSSPQVRVIEGERGRIEWHCSQGCGVQVDVSVNDGETWDALGDKAQGKADLLKLLPEWPVVRFQAFRGLHVFVDFFIPGQGFVKDTWSYRQQTYFTAGWYGQSQFSANPLLSFSVNNFNFPATYFAKIKFNMNWKRLPFDPKRLFPGKTIQKIFQAEWSHQSRFEKQIGIGAEFLNNPGRINGLRLLRVFKSTDASWEIDDLCPLGLDQPAMPGKYVYGYHGFRRDAKMHVHDEDLIVSFDDYYIIISD